MGEGLGGRNGVKLKIRRRLKLLMRMKEDDGEIAKGLKEICNGMKFGRILEKGRQITSGGVRGVGGGGLRISGKEYISMWKNGRRMMASLGKLKRRMMG